MIHKQFKREIFYLFFRLIHILKCKLAFASFRLKGIQIGSSSVFDRKRFVQPTYSVLFTDVNSSLPSQIESRQAQDAYRKVACFSATHFDNAHWRQALHNSENTLALHCRMDFSISF